MSEKQDILEILENLTDLPAMPGVVAELLRLTDSEDVELDDLVTVIERDPALAAKILQVCNSPYYGMRQRVANLKLATVVLGMREIRGIVLGISILDSMRGRDDTGSLPDDFWQHSWRTGALARALAAKVRLSTKGEDFVAGLLHDIGKLVLASEGKAEYTALLAQTGGHGEDNCEAERKLFGFTHADAAAALALKWNMPKALGDAIWLHHETEGASIAQAKEPALVALIRIANALAHADGEDGEALNAVAALPAWTYLDVDASDRAALLEECLEAVAEDTTPFA